MVRWIFSRSWHHPGLWFSRIPFAFGIFHLNAQLKLHRCFASYIRMECLGWTSLFQSPDLIVAVSAKFKNRDGFGCWVTFAVSGMIESLTRTTSNFPALAFIVFYKVFYCSLDTYCIEAQTNIVPLVERPGTIFANRQHFRGQGFHFEWYQVELQQQWRRQQRRQQQRRRRQRWWRLHHQQQIDLPRFSFWVKFCIFFCFDSWWRTDHGEW